MIHSAIAGRMRLGSKRVDETHTETGREKSPLPAVAEKVQTDSVAGSGAHKDEKPLEKVMSSFKEAVEISQQVTNTLKEMTTATESQTRNIEEVSTTIQSISSAIQQTASSASKAMKKAVGSDSIAKSASKDAEKGMQKMNEVKETIVQPGRAYGPESPHPQIRFPCAGTLERCGKPYPAGGRSQAIRTEDFTGY